jgi:hypothetical protein
VQHLRVLSGFRRLMFHTFPARLTWSIAYRSNLLAQVCGITTHTSITRKERWCGGCPRRFPSLQWCGYWQSYATRGISASDKRRECGRIHEAEVLSSEYPQFGDYAHADAIPDTHPVAFIVRSVVWYLGQLDEGESSIL